MKTSPEITKDFKAIEAQEKKMKTFSGSPQYYDEQKILNEMLIKFFRTEFTTLPMEKFLCLCDMVSTYRPVPPFSFLVSISMRKHDRIIKPN